MLQDSALLRKGVSNTDIVAAIFTKILCLSGFPEKKLDEMGFLGSIISALTSLLEIFFGYFLMKNLGRTLVICKGTFYFAYCDK